MRTAEKIVKLGCAVYQGIFGAKEKAFEIMLEILEKEHKHRYLKGGRSGKLSIFDKLAIMPCCYLEYRVMEDISIWSWRTICDSIQWVEDMLIKSGQFNLSPKNGFAWVMEWGCCCTN